MALLMVQPRQRRARDRRDSLSPAELLRFLVTGSPTETPGFTHDQAAALYAEYREQILDHEDRDDGRPVSWLVREFERDPEWRRRWLTDDLRELAELHEHYTRQENAGAVARLEQLIAGATDELAEVGRGETFTTSGNPGWDFDPRLTESWDRREEWAGRREASRLDLYKTPKPRRSKPR